MRVSVRGDVFETDLVTDFVAEIAATLEGDARGKQTGREPARLQDHHLPIAEQSMIEQDLRDLGRFSRAGRRLDNQPRIIRAMPRRSQSRVRRSEARDDWMPSHALPVGFVYFVGRGDKDDIFDRGVLLEK